MSSRSTPTLSAFLALCLSTLISPLLRAQSTDFTYQGVLREDGLPVSGIFDITITPYTSATGTTPSGQPTCFNDVSIIDGTFTVTLPVRASVDGAPLFLNIAVRRDTGQSCDNTFGYTSLLPRPLVTPAPLSVFTVAIRESAPPIRGAMRLHSDNTFQIFDGTVWRTVAPLASAPAAFDQSQTFSTPGISTFIVPANVHSITVLASGGGGGGGARGPGLTSIGSSCSGFVTFSAGGGGGGAGSLGIFRLDVTPGESLSIVVGAGGFAAPNSPGGNGGISRIARGASDLFRAPGGVGGGRTSFEVPMGNNPGTSCLNATTRATGGAGGAGGAAPSLLAQGTILAASQGRSGTAGQGPGCFSNIATDGTCPAIPGEPGVGLVSPVAADGVPATPNASGGTGGTTAVSTPGQPGFIVIYWN